MDTFIHFIQSPIGRLLRVIVGAAVMAVGVWQVGGAWGIVIAIVGAIPLIAGVLGVCLISPLFGYKMTAH